MRHATEQDSDGLQDEIMRNAVRVFKALFATILLLGANCVWAQDGGRTWTPRDSVAVRYVVALQDSPFAWDAGRSIQVSPAGKWLFFVTFHGDLDSDSNIFELNVFALDDIQNEFANPASKGRSTIDPLRTLSFESHSQYPAISNARWDDEGTGILFIGVKGDQAAQLFRLDIRSGELKALTNAMYQGVSPGYDVRAGSAVYKAATEMIKEPTVLDKYPSVAVSGEDLLRVLNKDLPIFAYGLFASFRNGVARQVVKFRRATFSIGPWLSPDGRWAIIVMSPEESSSQSGDSEAATKDSPLVRFMLIDVEHAAIKSTINSPTGMVIPGPAGKTLGLFEHVSPRAFWSSDSRHVILVNITIPHSSTLTAKPGPMAYIVDYDVATSSWRVLEPMKDSKGTTVDAVGWLAPGNELLVQHKTNLGKETSGTIYSVQEGGWSQRSASASLKAREIGDFPLPAGMAVSVRQNANDPPTPVASENGKEEPLVNPDPALAGVWRSEMKAIEVRERDGSTFNAGLMMPRSFRKNKDRPVPLVIQPYYYRPDLFLPDGYSPTAEAAQSLVAQGIAVLQMETIPPQVQMTPSQGPTFVKRVDAAVESLAKAGLIDPDRVGIVGWSHGGYMTHYAITHPGRTRLRAVIIADSWAGSYEEYLLWAGVGSSSAAEYGEQIGARGTFWSDKEEWLREANSFNMNRVRTPAMFTFSLYRAPVSTYSAIQRIGAFQINRLPLEILIFPQGEHALVRPRERFVCMEATVDWMKFWLMGTEDPKPKKSEQYERWHRLRELQDASPPGSKPK